MALIVQKAPSTPQRAPSTSNPCLVEVRCESFAESAGSARSTVTHNSLTLEYYSPTARSLLSESGSTAALLESLCEMTMARLSSTVAYSLKILRPGCFMSFFLSSHDRSLQTAPWSTQRRPWNKFLELTGPKDKHQKFPLSNPSQVVQFDTFNASTQDPNISSGREKGLIFHPEVVPVFKLLAPLALTRVILALLGVTVFLEASNGVDDRGWQS